MPIKITNSQSHDNDGHGYSFAKNADVEVHNPIAARNKGNGFNFEGEAQALTDLITKLKQELDSLESSVNNEQANVALNNLLHEAENSKASKDYIKQSINTLKDFAAKATGSGVGTLVLELIKAANEHWHLL